MTNNLTYLLSNAEERYVMTMIIFCACLALLFALFVYAYNNATAYETISTEDRNKRLYKRKSTIVEAIQWTGKNLIEVVEFVDNKKVDALSYHWDDYEMVVAKEGFKINTVNGKVKVEINFYIVKDITEEFSIYSPEYFEKYYEKLLN